MAGHGLKSDTKHHYQKGTVKFWEPCGRLWGYSEATKLKFELQAMDFEMKKRYIQWKTK